MFQMIVYLQSIIPATAFIVTHPRMERRHWRLSWEQVAELMTNSAVAVSPGPATAAIPHFSVSSPSIAELDPGPYRTR